MKLSDFLPAPPPHLPIPRGWLKKQGQEDPTFEDIIRLMKSLSKEQTEKLLEWQVSRLLRCPKCGRIFEDKPADFKCPHCKIRCTKVQVK